MPRMRTMAAILTMIRATAGGSVDVRCRAQSEVAGAGATELLTVRFFIPSKAAEFAWHR